MAREHARILTKIWDDESWCELMPDLQRLYMLLLSRKNVSQCGVLPLQVRKWAKGSKGTTEEDVVKTLAALEAERYIAVDEDTEEVLIRSFVRNDGVLKVPNVFKAALRAAVGVESLKLREILAGELRRLGRMDAAVTAQELFPIQSETVTEPVSNGTGTVDNPVDSVDKLLVPNGIPKPQGEGVGEGGGEPLVGGSVGRGRPSDRCSRHLTATEPPNCRGCAAARETLERWDREQATARKTAIHGCRLCDADGRRWDPAGKNRGTVGACDHRPLAAVS